MTAQRVERVADVIGCDDDTDVVDVPYTRLVSHKEKAVCFDFDDDLIWIPKSTVVDVDARSKMATIKKWIAVKKGIY